MKLSITEDEGEQHSKICTALGWCSASELYTCSDDESIVKWSIGSALHKGMGPGSATEKARARPRRHAPPRAAHGPLPCAMRHRAQACTIAPARHVLAPAWCARACARLWVPQLAGAARARAWARGAQDVIYHCAGPACRTRGIS